jgi:hypothetical protein
LDSCISGFINEICIYDMVLNAEEISAQAQ